MYSFRFIHYAIMISLSPLRPIPAPGLALKVSCWTWLTGISLHKAGTLHLSLLVEAQVLGSGNNAEGVGVTHTTSPALNADNSLAFAENAKLDCVHDAPLETAVNILLPRGRLEVRLLLGEVEGVHATVQVGILSLSALCSGER